VLGYTSEVFVGMWSVSKSANMDISSVNGAHVTTFLLATVVIMLALGLVSYVSSKRSGHATDDASALSLLPGDIKYESPEGKFVFYFPITTSIVVSLLLTLVLWLFR
jgi:hypothetical protein